MPKERRKVIVDAERSPPHPKDTGHLKAKRLNARHRQKPATLALKINKKGPKTVNISPKWVPKFAPGPLAPEGEW